MSLFSKILEKLGIHPHADGGPATASPASAAVTPPAAAAPAVATAQGAAAAPSTAAVAVANDPAPIGIVDVEAQLEKRAAANPQKLNWRTSIVDLLKLLDLDSSLEARKELAAELHCPPELMQDSAKMNVWLHQMVLAKIAVNGGSIPKSMLD